MKPLFLLALMFYAGGVTAPASELRFCLRAEPKTLDPHLVVEQAGATVRYLTAGVLIRMNRLKQAPEPELATSWKIGEGGRSVTFELRQGIKFSDGRPFTAEDVTYSLRRIMDPKLQSPLADIFRSTSGDPVATAITPHRVLVRFPAAIAGIERLFDQAVIVPSTGKLDVGLGPFAVVEHRPGSHIVLRRNDYYWKTDARGVRLPYIDTVRLDIQRNRELELMRFRRGQLHLVGELDPELFDRLSAENQSLVRDLGAGMESQQIWFNQVPGAPLPAHKKAWFRSTAFRRAISAAINRADLSRVVYRGHATPAAGPVSPANKFWFNQSLKPHVFDVPLAKRLLASDGFKFNGGALFDRGGARVEFSVITNSGNTARERMAVMIQQDLAQIGIRVNVVPMDFPSLIERITQTFDYEACLLGFTNVEQDPNTQMNIWLSSGANHQWNPKQKTPATPWEAEIDHLMNVQARTMDARKRKHLFDRVQQILYEQEPFLYLVNPNVLIALAPALKNVEPALLYPQTYWNIERLWLSAETARLRR
jgi:peptide/nickel transport system substrate-binding protein